MFKAYDFTEVEVNPTVQVFAEIDKHQRQKKAFDQSAQKVLPDNFAIDLGKVEENQISHLPVTIMRISHFFIDKVKIGNRKKEPEWPKRSKKCPVIIIIIAVILGK